ncbi:hypothetical protein L226DRAFT_610463 [Lentinus tigrinus ALCF2SS1-7]|uniref:uncharacterized protein n=1 Tax=Lentinus tigrinus ALCF2SS1-7 TaxID=1328758 RepID=UPI001166076C|nr:hypothetical protein L226DRAFT_610463 [Lentinus tigrinus ALCF2SS1-7]
MAALARTIEIYGIVQDEKYVYSASTAVLVYDILLTMDREVKLFWTGQFSGATIVYVAVRSMGLLVNILGFGTHIPTLDQKSCDAVTKAWDALEALEYLPSAVFSGMRAFALTRRWYWGALIFVLALSPVAVNLTDLIIYTFGAAWPVIGCYMATRPMKTWIHTLVLVLSRAPLITADILLIIITLRTLRYGSGAFLNAVRVRKRRSLSDVMLWNGMLYFVAITILNILVLVLNVGGTETSGVAGWVGAFAPPLNTILISRFLLDLQEANSQDVGLAGDDTYLFTESIVSVGTLNFPRVFGSIGSTIDPLRATAEVKKDPRKGEVDSLGGSELSEMKFAQDMEGLRPARFT